MTTFLCPCCMTSLVPLPAILSLTAACPADSTFRVCLGGCFIYLVIYSFYHHNCPVRGQLSSGMGLTEETHLHIPLPSCHQRTSPATTTRVHSGEQISEKAPAPCLLLTEKLARLWIMSVGNQKLVTNLRQRTGEITSWTGFSGTRVWGRYEKVAQGNGAFNILFSVEKKSSRMTSAMDRWKTPNFGRPSWIVQGEREKEKQPAPKELTDFKTARVKGLNPGRFWFLITESLVQFDLFVLFVDSVKGITLDEIKTFNCRICLNFVLP